MKFTEWGIKFSSLPIIQIDIKGRWLCITTANHKLISNFPWLLPNECRVAVKWLPNDYMETNNILIHPELHKSYILTTVQNAIV